MNSANDSVIICDTPSPGKTTKWMDAVVTDYKKRLRSSNMNSLLGTVYESPLMHFKRNKIGANDTILELNDVTIVPPTAKKRKTKAKPSTSMNRARLENLDESVVIVEDTITAVPAEETQPIVELGLSDTETNDVVEVSEPNSSPKRLEAKTLRKAKKKDKTGVKQFRLKPTEMKKKNKKKVMNLKTPAQLIVVKDLADAMSINDENHNGQIMEKNTKVASGHAEEVEVVWVSGPEAADQQVASADQPFIVDTVPSLTNLVKTINLKAPKKKRGNISGSTSAAWANCGAQNDGRYFKCPGRLREIVIDGSNVGMGYTCGKSFSETGLKLVIDYFKNRGHVVKAFLPQKMRSRDRPLLERLHKEGTVVFTPSRLIGGRMIVPYDDRYILDYATQCDGIVISSDQYRDLWLEKPQWRNTIENRLLTPTFAGDYLMFPEDPLGRFGPKLEEFLRY